jgi:hypothetical protein
VIDRKCYRYKELRPGKPCQVRLHHKKCTKAKPVISNLLLSQCLNSEVYSGNVQGNRIVLPILFYFRKKYISYFYLWKTNARNPYMFSPTSQSNLILFRVHLYAVCAYFLPIFCCMPYMACNFHIALHFVLR